MKILLVEDEETLAKFVSKALEAASMNVDAANDGFAGKSLAMINKYDVIILDVILPKITGLELCRELRSKNIKTPILMLTALGSLEDKLQGFEQGADDYLVKPFEIKELIARIHALHKRNDQLKREGDKLEISDLSMDLSKNVVTRNNAQIVLTAKEFNLLEFFMRNPGRIISRSEIAEEVWNTKFDTGTNVIDVYMNFLRKKIDKQSEKKLFHTVVGMGYILQENYNEDQN
jgi:two-component system, OmpR family, copper resistance phosphate regulon response regulator CusR